MLYFHRVNVKWGQYWNFGTSSINIDNEHALVDIFYSHYWLVKCHNIWILQDHFPSYWEIKWGRMKKLKSENIWITYHDDYFVFCDIYFDTIFEILTILERSHFVFFFPLQTSRTFTSQYPAVFSNIRMASLPV